MPAISFSVMLPKLLDGSKTQTIRQRKDVKEEDTLRMYWKQRVPIEKKEWLVSGPKTIAITKNKLDAEFNLYNGIIETPMFDWIIKPVHFLGLTIGLNT